MREGWRTTIEILEEVKFRLQDCGIQMSYTLGRKRGVNHQIENLSFSTGLVVTTRKDINRVLKDVSKVKEFPLLLSSDKDERESTRKRIRSNQATRAAEYAKISIREKYGSFSNMFRDVRCEGYYSKIGETLKAGYKSGKIKTWNSGLKGSDSEELYLKLVVPKLGENNPMHKSRNVYSHESRAKQSKTMKSKILSGEFTPNVNNSNTHWDAEFNCIKFRSSWEAAFYSYYDGCLLYEKVRIPWEDEKGDLHIYIVDFLDENTKALFEIKPKSLIERNHNNCVEKIAAAQMWADKNGYSFQVIMEDNICENWDKISSQKNLFCEETFDKLASLYENYSKN
jgi:hypothetical protein